MNGLTRKPFCLLQIARRKMFKEALVPGETGGDGQGSSPNGQDIRYGRAMQKLAAIEIQEGQSSSTILDAVAQALKAEGIVVAGYLQRELSQQGDTVSDTVLEDIETGEQFSIMQALGASAASCRLDTGALADIAGRTIGRLERPTDILILNRFGKAEAEGHGLRAALERAISRDIPVLTLVESTYLKVWRDYVGDMAASLPPVAADALAWYRSLTNTATR